MLWGTETIKSVPCHDANRTKTTTETIKQRSLPRRKPCKNNDGNHQQKILATTETINNQRRKPFKQKMLDDVTAGNWKP